MRHRRGETVVLHSRVLGGVDEYGADVSSWVDSEVEGVAVALTSVQEPSDEGLWRVVEKGALYFDPPLVPDPADEFTVRGSRFMVDQSSELSTWTNPYSGRVVGSEVHVRQVTG